MTSTASNGTMHYISWNYLFNEIADPRSQHLYLIKNPIPLFLINVSYLYFVLKCGPRFMQSRKPHSLKKIMIVYNIFQIIFNTYIFVMVLQNSWTFNWICQAVDPEDTPSNRMAIFAGYLYFVNKIIDLLDTAFFVLRKKNSQITFLHLYHHTLMMWMPWWVLKYMPGGQYFSTALLNSFVHILLYLYYFLAALGPEIQKYLWWKKYLTMIQLIQFMLVIIHNIFPLFIDCGFPKSAAYVPIVAAGFFYYLFHRFYQKSYTKKPKQK